MNSSFDKTKMTKAVRQAAADLKTYGTPLLSAGLHRVAQFDRLALIGLLNVTGNTAIIAKDGMSQFLGLHGGAPSLIQQAPWLTLDMLAGLFWLASDPPLIFGSNTSLKDKYAKVSFIAGAIGSMAWAAGGVQKSLQGHAAHDQLACGIFYAVSYIIGSTMKEGEPTPLPERQPGQSWSQHKKQVVRRYAQNLSRQPLRLAALLDIPALATGLSTSIRQNNPNMWVSEACAFLAVGLLYSTQRDSKSPLIKPPAPTPPN